VGGWAGFRCRDKDNWEVGVHSRAATVLQQHPTVTQPMCPAEDGCTADLGAGGVCC
jgi:hypothetical protein